MQTKHCGRHEDLHFNRVLLKHLPKLVFATNEYTNTIDLNDPPPIIEVSIPGHFQRTNDTRKVSSVIDSSELFNCLLDSSFDLVFFCDVCSDGDALLQSNTNRFGWKLVGVPLRHTFQHWLFLH